MTAIRVELQFADGSFTSGMLRAGQSMAHFERELVRANPRLRQFANEGRSVITTMQRSTEASRGFLATLRDVSIVTGALSMGISAVSRAANGWLGDVVRVNAEMERLTMLMKSMSTADDPFADATDSVRYLREQAAKMPFSLNQISSAFVKLKATGVDPTAGSLQALADGVAAFGGSDQHFERIVLGITQMSGKGVIQMEELRQQLGESMPGAIQIMARSMGVSVAQLSKDISTGTVEAKSALEQFYAEVERSYGGSAQRMMQSFSGQVAQLRTNLQLLATSEGGKGFFDQIKTQLQDINDFLQSDFAKGIAQQIGQTFASFVDGARTALETVWRFRSELVTLAKVAGGIWAAVLVNNAITTFRTGMLATTVALRAFGTAMATGWSTAALGVTGFRSLSTSIIGVQMAALGAGTALRGLVAAVPVLGALTLALGSAVYMLSGYFKSNAQAAREAHDEIVNYGNATADATKKVTDRLISELEKEEKEILSRLEDFNTGMNNSFTPGDKSFFGDLAEQARKELQEVRDEMVKVRAEGAEALSAARERDDMNAMRSFERKLSEEIGVLRAHHIKQAEEDRKNHERRLAEAEETGESAAKIDEEYKLQTMATAMELEQKIREIYSVSRQGLLDQMEGAGEERLNSIRKLVEFVDGQILATEERMKGIEAGRGVKTFNTGEDQTKAIQSGQQARDKLKRDIAELVAEFNGASGAVAGLNQRIADGDYGSIKEGGEEVRLLHEELREATKAKEALDKLMKGKNAVDQELERIRKDLIEQEIDLLERKAGRTFTDAERLLMRMDRGLFEGYGPGKATRQLIEDASKMFEEQATKAASVGDAIKNEAFGGAAIQAINDGTEALARFLGVATRTDGVLRGFDFSGFGFMGDDFLPGGAHSGGAAITRHAGSFLDLIGRAEGTDKGRGYNETLAYGKFTGGDRNLIGMTLNEIDKLQSQMLKHPANHFNSSAVGRYQIVQKTLRGLRDQMGLTGEELYDPAMQDRLATQLMKRRGNNVAGLRNEWEGLRRVDPNTIQQAYAGHSAPAPAVGPTREAAAAQQAANDQRRTALSLEQQLADNQAEQRRVANEYIETQKRMNEANGIQASADYYKNLEKRITTAKDNVDDLGKHHQKLLDDIEAGKIFKDVTDVADPRFKELIELAKQVDEVEERRVKLQEAKKGIEEDNLRFKEQELEFERQLADAKAKAKDPNYEGSTSAFRSLNDELDKYIERQRTLHGEGTPEFEAALQYRTHRLQQQGLLESTQRQAELIKETQDLEESVMTQAQIRERGMQRQLEAVDRWVEKARQAGMSEVEITETAERAKAAIRAKYEAEASPMQKQMKEWGDLQGQLAQASTRWMDSLAGGLTDLIMGTGDLRSVIQGILKDIINMGIKYIMSQLMGGGGSKGAKGAKGAMSGKGASAGKMGGGKKMFGMAHRGGIIGSSNLLGRAASPVSFIGAPKFHTGGIVGKGLLPSEVPIIAKKGEGVFTPEQMEMMGGFQQNQAFQINAPITVNGSAGTPEQNADLSKKMAREMEVTMRTVVADEIRKQTRPGNALNKR